MAGPDPIVVNTPGRGVLMAGSTPDPSRSMKTARFLALLTEDGPQQGHVERCRALARIGHGTLWDWLESDPDFKREYQWRLRSLEGNVSGSLYQRAISETVDPRAANVAAIVWGKRHFPELYLEARLSAVNVNVGVFLEPGQARTLLADARRLEQEERRAAARTVDALPAAGDPTPEG